MRNFKLFKREILLVLLFFSQGLFAADKEMINYILQDWFMPILGLLGFFFILRTGIKDILKLQKEKITFWKSMNNLSATFGYITFSFMMVVLIIHVINTLEFKV